MILSYLICLVFCWFFRTSPSLNGFDMEIETKTLVLFKWVSFLLADLNLILIFNCFNSNCKETHCDFHSSLTNQNSLFVVLFTSSQIFCVCLLKTNLNKMFEDQLLLNFVWFGSKLCSILQYSLCYCLRFECFNNLKLCVF